MTKTWLPYVPAHVPVWRWPRKGVGVPTQYSAPTSQLTADIDDYWWYDWTGQSRNSKHVPMAWGLGSLPATIPASNNDGRPLLVLNEPDVVGQANCSPDQAADFFHIWSQVWKGELWPLGTLAHNLDYVIRTMNSYEFRYGSWPGTGWAIHAYSNRAVWCLDLCQEYKLRIAVDDVRNFAAYMEGRGLLGRGIVISECGVLSAQYWHTTAEVAPAVQYLYRELSALPYVRSVNWFSSYYAPCSSSDLVRLDGSLTECGQEWRRR